MTDPTSQVHYPISVSVIDQCSVGDTQSAAIKRRSRCGVVRGFPEISSHFLPGSAPQVGQFTASACLRVAFLAFMVVDDAAIRRRKMVNFAQESWIVGEIVRREKALDFSGCNSRPGTGSLHPEAIEAAVEATKLSEPSMERVV